MSHLSLETLARLVDETPDTTESAHLESCDDCRAELEVMRDDVHALGMLPDMTPAPDGWAALERRLDDEGLIRTRRTTAAPRVLSSRMMQMAAALVLFLAGSLAGRMTAAPAPSTMAFDATSPPTVTGTAVTASDAADVANAGDAPVGAAPDTRDVAGLIQVDGEGPRVARVDRPQPRQPSSTRLASTGGGFNASSPQTMDEAAALLRETEAMYLTALTRYAEFATQSEVGDPVARLAALQSIVMTTQAALSQTPADPVINGVHLATLAQRDATLAQVAASTSGRWYE